MIPTKLGEEEAVYNEVFDSYGHNIFLRYFLFINCYKNKHGLNTSEKNHK